MDVSHVVLGPTFSPSMPGHRYLKFSSQRRSPDRNLCCATPIIACFSAVLKVIKWRYDALAFDSSNMLSPKRHVLISLPFILKHFSKPFVSTNLSFLRKKDSRLIVMSRVRGRTYVSHLHCFILRWARTCSIPRAPRAAAIASFMSPLNPLNPWWVMM